MFRHIPHEINEIIERDIRETVIKLCIGEIEDESMLDLSQTIITIRKFYNSKKSHFAISMYKIIVPPSLWSLLNMIISLVVIN